jgi:cytochrome c oxidase cbb3-type subunit 2
LAAAQVPATETNAAASAVAGKNVAGFDYATLGPQVYAQNCAACHGAGVPGAFPSLAGDPVVNGSAADVHILIVLKGLAGKAIGGVHFASQMPAFGAQLTDAQIAAVIDHERTSWGNHGPLITPNQVKRDR